MKQVSTIQKYKPGMSFVKKLLLVRSFKDKWTKENVLPINHMVVKCVLAPAVVHVMFFIIVL